MAQILAIAYNTGPTIPGTLQYGVLAVSNSNRDYSNNYGGVTWWATPDLSQRYVIGYPDPSGSHPTPIEGITAYLGFWGSELKTDESFLFLVNNIPATVGIDDFIDVTTANNWLFDNGYWSSYPLDETNERLSPKALELCDIYQSCNGDGSIILILDEHAVNYPVGKWFDGNCYYRTGQQTYSNDFTFLSGPSYNNCDNCNTDCLLYETLSTVECTLVTSVSQVTRPADPTPTPTPTPTSPCFNPSVDIVSCQLDSEVVESLYSVRLRACCKDYLNEPYYIITKNINFLGITPVEGFVILYNGICYEILTITVINDSTNLYIEPNPVSTMIGGTSPCKTCTTYYAPCVSLVTPTPTPTPTENYREDLTLRLTSCCEDKSIIVSVSTVLPIIVNDVVVVNSECYKVILVSPYISGVTIPIDSSNHYSSLVHSQPCLECERRVPCGPEKTKAVTPTPTPTPTGVAETRIFTGRVCCGNPRFDLVNIIIPENYTLTPGTGFVYDGYCYEIISEYFTAPLVTEVTTNDLKPIDCNSPNCCDDLVTPTPTPTQSSSINTCIDCKGLNITFVIDYTSDMGDLINTMKSNIGGFVDILDNQTQFYNLGLNIFDESLSQYPNYFGSVVYLIQTSSSQKIVENHDGLYQFFTSIVDRSPNNGSNFLSKFNYLNTLSLPIGDGNLDPDPVNTAVKYSQQVSFSGPLDNLNEYENFVVLVSNAMPGGNDEVYNSQDSNYSLGSIQTTLINNNTKLLFFTDNSYVYSNSPLVEVAENTGGQTFFTSDPITELKNYIDVLCCDLPTPTPTPTNTPTPTIPVTPTSTLTPTPSPTPGPLPPIDSNTQIRFWFDNSGSMDNVYGSVNYAVTNLLSDCLLEYYNNNTSLYNQRVQIHDMCFNNDCAQNNSLTLWATQNGVPNYVLNESLMENFLLCMSLPPTNGADKVINIVIQDEAATGFHGGTSSGWSIIDPRTSLYDTSLSFLKNKIDNSNSTIFGGLIVIPGTSDGQFQFNMLTDVVWGGTVSNYGQGQYGGVNGINGNYQAYLKRKTLWSNNNSTNSYIIAENVIDILNELGAGITQC